MILWEEESLNDREKIFEFLYDFNPDVAEKTDNIIEAKVESLLEQPLMGVQRDGIRGRLLIIPCGLMRRMATNAKLSSEQRNTKPPHNTLNTKINAY